MNFRECNKAWKNLGKNQKNCNRRDRPHKTKNYENKKDNDKVESLPKKK